MPAAPARSRTLLCAALLLAGPLAGCPRPLPVVPPPVRGASDGKPAEDPARQAAGRRAALDAYVRGLGAAAAPADQQVVLRKADEPDGDLACAVQDLKETRSFDRAAGLGANSEALWPGAIVAGDGAGTGLLSQIVFDRAPLRFSVSLERLDGARSALMARPSLSAYREELGRVLGAEVKGQTPANVAFQREEIHSEKQLALALGIDAARLGSVAAQLRFDAKGGGSHYLVQYTQTYYTVDVDQPGGPADLLGPSVTIEEARQKLGAGVGPAYVSSIVYGRKIVFTISSSYSAAELSAALDAAFASVGSAQLSLGHREVIRRSRISATILGGSADRAARAIESYEDLTNLIKEGGQYSSESPGAPIAYKLASLRDNSPVRLSFTQEYQVRRCTRVSGRLRVTLRSITVRSDGGELGGLALYGRIGASAKGGATLFDKTRKTAVTVKQGQSWPAPGQGPIREAVLQVTPAPGQAVELSAELRDRNLILADGEVGREAVSVPFETGWQRDVNLTLTGDNAEVVITFGLEPI
jgi:thiol-activated cytolysin